MARVGILIQLTEVHEGMYYVEVPEDATMAQCMEALARERREFEIDPKELFDEKVGSYSTTYEVEMGLE